MTDLPLVVENLTFRYRARPEPAIRNISFSAAAGELLLDSTCTVAKRL